MKLVLAMCVCAAVCAAQHGGGYMFAGPATFVDSSFTYWQGTRAHIGAGGEAGVGQHLTLGGEIGYLTSSGRFSRSAALASFNGSGFFIPARSSPSFDPFVTGGVSLLVRDGAAAMPNVGGGFNYWFLPRLGLRAEVRDHLWLTEGTALQILSFRFGLAFRR
jgi:hypothetical protein